MDSRNVTSPARAFDAAVVVLLNATGDYAVANSSRLFATGKEGFFASEPTIYGLTQCTPDMSPPTAEAASAASFRACHGTSTVGRAEQE
jgi:hypothetical protein